MPKPAPFRLLRSGVVALSTLFIAGGAHIGAGGQLPALPILAAMASLVLLLCVLLAQWKLTTPAMLAVLAASQLALHQGFEWFAIGPMSEVTLGLGHQHGMPSHIPDLAMPEHLANSGGVLMLFMHCAATAMTALLLARGEATLWALAAWLRPLIERTMPVFVPLFRRPDSPPRSIEKPLPECYLSSHRWRGPPSHWMTFKLS